MIVLAANTQEMGSHNEVAIGVVIMLTNAAHIKTFPVISGMRVLPNSRIPGLYGFHARENSLPIMPLVISQQGE